MTRNRALEKSQRAKLQGENQFICLTDFILRGNRLNIDLLIFRLAWVHVKVCVIPACGERLRTCSGGRTLQGSSFASTCYPRGALVGNAGSQPHPRPTEPDLNVVSCFVFRSECFNYILSELLMRVVGWQGRVPAPGPSVAPGDMSEESPWQTESETCF